MRRLVTLRDSSGREQAVKLGRETITIGKGPDCKIILSGESVSAHHSQILFEDGVSTLLDLGSHSGTFVNNQQVRRRVLSSGDTIRIGRHELMYQEQTISDVYSTADSHRRPLPDKQVNEESIKVLKVFEVEDTSDKRPILREVTGEDGLSPLVKDLTVRSLTSLVKAVELLNFCPDLQRFSNGLVDLLHEATESETVVLLLLNEESYELEAKSVRHSGPIHPGEIPVSRTVVNMALRDNAALTSVNAPDDPRFQVSHSVHQFKVGSVLAVPFWRGGQACGVFYLARSGWEMYGEEHVNLATAFGHLAAVALDRHVLASTIV